MNLLNVMHPPFPDARRVLCLYAADPARVDGYAGTVARIFPEARICLAGLPARRLVSPPDNITMVDADLQSPISATQEEALRSLVSEGDFDLILIQGEGSLRSCDHLVPCLGGYHGTHRVFYVAEDFSAEPLNPLLALWQDPVRLIDADFQIECPGWITGRELALLHRLARQRPASDCVVELGRHYGRSTIALGHAVKQAGSGTLVSIDPWLQRDFMETMQAHCVSKYVEVWTETPQDAFDRWRREHPDRTIGLLFVDAGGRGDSLARDLRNWSRLLVPGGVIACLHYDECHPACLKAVNEELLWSGRFEEFQSKGRLIVARKKETPARVFLHHNPEEQLPVGRRQETGAGEGPMNLLNRIEPPISGVEKILYLYMADPARVDAQARTVSRIFPQAEICLAGRAEARLRALPENMRAFDLEWSVPLVPSQAEALGNLIGSGGFDLILIQGDAPPSSYSYFHLVPLLSEFRDSHDIVYAGGDFSAVRINAMLHYWRRPAHLEEPGFTIDCPGLMLDRELEALHRLALQRPASDCVVELGRYYGRSTLALGHAVKQTGWGTLVSIDPWLQEDFMETMRAHCVSKFVEVWTETSLGGHDRWLRERPDRSIGMLFVDADHSYSSVSQDIRTWSRLLVPGGILACHDYADAWSPCMHAINEQVIWSGEFDQIELIETLLVARKKTGPGRGTR